MFAIYRRRLRQLVLTVVYTLGILGIVASGGGGGSGSDDESTTTTTTTLKAISGGGVKGPLANAIVTVYAFDSSKTDFKGSEVATASTDASAAIVGLALPFPVSPPYILEFTSNGGTTDITTGAAPVIGTMRTVITQALLDSGEQIYATPLTTMAVDIAVVNAANTNGTLGIQADEFEAALLVAADQVVSTVGFGMSGDIDIFDTPPLIDNTTDSAESQADVAAYRTAVEAVTAIAFQINQQTAGGDTDSVLAELSADLADGGGIDGSAGTQIDANTLQVFEQDPATLPIPNEPDNKTVAEVQAILVAETVTTGTTTSTTELEAGGSITTTPEPAQTDPDLDADGVLNADDAYPNDVTADTDTDGDGAPDVAYTNANRDTVDPTRSDSDDDNDGWADSLDDYALDNTRFLDPAADRDGDFVVNGGDNCPLIENTDQTDTDGNGQGDACSNDNDGDGVDDGIDNCPLIANPGQEDLDGDQVPGIGGGDACDDDIDGDTTLNDADAFPLDAGETVDSDGDGVGDNGDADDDNDGVDDIDYPEGLVAPVGAPSAGIACSLLRDCDGDGVFDGADFNPLDSDVTFNFAPVANSDAATVDEDATTFAIAVTANDTDDDGNPDDTVSLTAVGSHDTSLGAAVPNGNNINYTPVADASGTDTFTYTVTDGNVTATGSVTVTVNAVNDSPVATDDAAATNEDIPVTTVNVLANDNDVENDSLSVAAGNPTATSGTVVNNGDGSFTYTPNANINGADSFDYTVIDGNGGSDVGTVSITIGSINDAPDAVDDSLTTDEDTAGTTLNVLANDTDVENDGLSVSAFDSATANGGGVFDNDDGTYTYTPAADFNGADSFTYTITDGNGGSDVATVNVTVNAVNDAPTATAPTLTVEEDSATPGTSQISVNDVDSGDTHTYTLKTDGTKGTASVGLTTGLVSYTPTAADYNGPDSVVVAVSDSGNPVATVDVTITVDVTAANDAPTASAPTLTVAEDSITSGTSQISVVDADSGDTHTYDMKTQGAEGTASVDASGLVSYTPTTADYNGPDSVVVTVSDSGNPVATVDVTITVNVTAANDAPTASAPTLTVEEDSATPGTSQISVNDVDSSDTHTYTLKTDGTKGTASVGLTTGLVSYTPTAADYNGADSVVVTVSDSAEPAGTVDVTITVDVTAANDAPTATAPTLTVEEDSATPGTSQISVIDADSGDTHTYTLKTDGTKGTASVGLTTGLASYTPTTADYNGPDSVVVTVIDSGNPLATVDVTITVDVTAVNDDPVAMDDALELPVNGSVINFVVLGNDSDVADGDDLSVLSNTSASHGDLAKNSDDTFNYTPDTDYVGPDSFTYTVSDGNGGSAVGTVNITVNPLGSPIAIEILLDPAQGGGILTEIDSWLDVLPQFELFSLYYDSIAGTIEGDHRAYDYNTKDFVDISEWDVLFLTAGGQWLVLDQITVDIPNNDDGSADISFRNQGAVLGSANISTFVSDIVGERLDSYLDGEWLNYMLDPDAEFGAGAQFVTSFRLEALDDRYEINIDTWCEDEDPTRWAASNGNCNGIYDYDSGTFAATLANVQTDTPYVDLNDGTKAGLVAIELAHDEISSTDLLVELQSGTNDAAYYKVDHQATTDEDYITLLLTDSYLPPANVNGVQMLQLTIPSQLIADFPELAEDAVLERGYVVQDDLVREVEISRTGQVESIPGLNGIARDQILDNFDPPTAPDITELIGTWIADQSSNGEFAVFHYFANTYYEASGACVINGVAGGMEYGTLTADPVTGAFTATASVNDRDACSLQLVGSAGGTISVNGDVLTLNVPGYWDITYTRLKGDLNPLVGSWILGDIDSPGSFGVGGHTILTFLNDDTITLSENCTDGETSPGYEYGNYSWDEATLSGTLATDSNGGCGLHDNEGLAFNFPVTVAGDVLTIGGVEMANRHSPASEAFSFDDFFDNNTYTDNWTVTGNNGTVTESGGILRVQIPEPLSGCEAVNIDLNTPVNGQTIIVETRVAQYGKGGLYLRLKKDNLNLIELGFNTDDVPYLEFATKWDGVDQRQYIESSTPYLTSYNVLKIVKTGNTYTAFVNDIQKGEAYLNEGIGFQNLIVELRNHTCSHKTGDSDNNYDFVHVVGSGGGSEPGSTGLIVGAWGEQEYFSDEYGSAVFYSDGRYIITEEAGVEYGNYTHDNSTGVFNFTCLYDETPDGGLCYSYTPATVTDAYITGDELNWIVDGIPESATRVVSNTMPVVGAWGSPEEEEYYSIVFYSDGRYIVSEPQEYYPGVEYGTYTHDNSTGVFSYTCFYDGTPDSGLCMEHEPATGVGEFYVIGDSLIDPEDDERECFMRVGSDDSDCEVLPAVNYAIGDTGPAGGIVFYVTDGGAHGFEAAPVDIDSPAHPGALWGCSGASLPGADGTAVGTGAQNTTDILAGCDTADAAARLVEAYRLNGYTDWFLPSIDELVEMFNNIGRVGTFGWDYLSSSEADHYRAHGYDNRNGARYQYWKSVPVYVRAIRAF